MTDEEIAEFNAQYEAQEGLEENLLSQGNDSLELALNGNFSNNGHGH
jgi:hypothetical protein